MQSTTIAVDLAKNVFQIAVSRRPGRVAEHHRLSRARFLRFFAQRQPATVVMEACGSAHPWGRQITALGHHVVLLPPQYVRPYVRRDKTDRADAEALLEAFRDRSIRHVPIKSVPQQTLAALHRLRSAWIGDRTGRINAVRGILRELGIVLPMGARKFPLHLAELIADADSQLPEPLREPLAEACLEIRELGERVGAVEAQLEALTADIPQVARLRSIPGIGLLTATALVAAIGDFRRFPSGRHLASFLGLTPREHSSGLARRLGKISKRGDSYLRMLLVHGARSVLRVCEQSGPGHDLGRWVVRLKKRRSHNVATVALANKMARIAWAVATKQTRFEPGAIEI
jgi:transposase